MSSVSITSMCNVVDAVIYEDDRLLVFDKPSGLLSVPGIGEEKQDCLGSRAATAFPGARIVHRLDRDTSGVIILARDPEAHRQLSIQFQERQTEKVYQAIVFGVPVGHAGAIDLPMRKNLDDPPRQMIDHEHGRSAHTRWRVLETSGDRVRIELRPTTGRSHQLRLHMKEIGHPILGDDLYAPPKVCELAERLMLHAWKLTIAHPSTAAPMTFTAPLPF